MKNNYWSLGINSELNSKLNEALENLQKSDVLRRLWEHDYTLWSDSPDEIENRLGWLHLHETMRDKLSEIDLFVNHLRDENFDQAILLGMGGSSLAPEVFSKIFGKSEGFLDLTILDSTDPGAIQKIQSQINLEKTIFIVATKSGGTVETLSFFKFFYNLISEKNDPIDPGKHFIAITDPGSQLEKLGKKLKFREVFLNDPNIGGRYSALSYFGLIPAALIGVNTVSLLDQAEKTAFAQKSINNPRSHFSSILGALIGIAANNGRDKLTILSDDSIKSFSDWIEQLVAESTGKSGTGILPVVGEKFPEDIKVYGKDRLFVVHQDQDSNKTDVITDKLEESGHPFIKVILENKYQLGSLMFEWEIATALASYILNIHPFNQPNVESSKILTKQFVLKFQEKGKLPKPDIKPFTAKSLEIFLSNIKPGDYISIHAYTNPSLKTEKAFRKFQVALRDKYEVAVTFGFGPRFLHSTGQLHKGDAGNGYFIQFISDSTFDIDIPLQAGSSESIISFDMLKKAQALGDANALKQANRRIISLMPQESIADNILELTARIK